MLSRGSLMLTVGRRISLWVVLGKNDNWGVICQGRGLFGTSRIGPLR